MNFSTLIHGTWACDDYLININREGTFTVRFKATYLPESPTVTYACAVAACEKHKKENEESEYLKLHKASKIKPGDWVKVTQKVPSNDKGWNANWNHYMDSLVGKVGKVVEDLEQHGFHLEFENEDWNFPVHALQKGKKVITPYSMVEFCEEVVKRAKDKKDIYVLVSGVRQRIEMFEANDTYPMFYCGEDNRVFSPDQKNITWENGDDFGIVSWE